jgi:hypothetical protein
MNTHDDGLDTKSPDAVYYESLSLQQRQVWDRQELFLQAFARLGKKIRAAEHAGISVKTVEDWQSRDLRGFNKRLAQAHDRYVEQCEEQMDRTIEQKPAATQILQIFRLKAEAPEKYREEVKVVGIEASKQMMDRLRELAAKDRQALPDEGVLEGEFRALNETPRPPAPAETPAPGPIPEPSPTTSAKARLMAQRREKPRGRVVRR